MSCEVQLLRAGVHTRAHRHTSSTIYHVIEGSGHSIINGAKVDWAEHDTLVLPSWSWHEHVNASASDRAILFSLSDWPTMRALGFYREEALPAGFQ
jgi:gentisate 1,2-dioxygenase